MMKIINYKDNICIFYNKTKTFHFKIRNTLIRKTMTCGLKKIVAQSKFIFEFCLKVIFNKF